MKICSSVEISWSGKFYVKLSRQDNDRPALLVLFDLSPPTQTAGFENSGDVIVERTASPGIADGHAAGKRTSLGIIGNVGNYLGEVQCLKRVCQKHLQQNSYF